MMENQKLLKMQEQQSLIKAEKKLKEMIEKINECANVLKVEELQLRANLISDQSKRIRSNKSSEPKFKIIEIPEYINSQVMDLKVNQSLKTFDEEYESE